MTNTLLLWSCTPCNGLLHYGTLELVLLLLFLLFISCLTPSHRVFVRCFLSTSYSRCTTFDPSLIFTFHMSKPLHSILLHHETGSNPNNLSSALFVHPFKANHMSTSSCSSQFYFTLSLYLMLFNQRNTYCCKWCFKHLTFVSGGM